MATKRKHPDKPTGVRFDAEQRRWLVEYAVEHDLSVSQVVRRAVSLYRDFGGRLPDAARKAGL